MKKDTRLRILDAAEKVFAKAGWIGATTQEIARAAKVNEVTLFRHFGNKQLLFIALVGRFIEARQQAVAGGLAGNAPMEEVLARFAESHHRSLIKSADFIRTMLGEAGRHPKELRKVIDGTAKPLRDQMLRLLGEWQRRGEIRADVDCEAALDLFSAMFFGNAIKRHRCGAEVGYTDEEYRALAVAVFVRGIRP